MMRGKVGLEPEGMIEYEADSSFVGKVGREGDMMWGRESRDTWYAGLTCKDWEDGVREHVERLLAR